MQTLNDLHVKAHGVGLDAKAVANLQYVVIKLVRLGVSPSHLDSWHDLGNYAHLSEGYYGQL